MGDESENEDLDLDEEQRMRNDQGNYEMEVGMEGSVQWEKCTKNPGHLKFISPLEISPHHLPEEYRTEDVIKYINISSRLTFRLVVWYISMDRPVSYPFYQHRGKKMPHTGTCSFYSSPMHIETGTSCPCPPCVRSTNPSKTWYKFEVTTARHVVFDNEEAKMARVDVDFDMADKSKAKTFHCVGMSSTDSKADTCVVTCVTHDIALVDELAKLKKEEEQLASKLEQEHNKKTSFPLAVVISHPHGCSKYVTVGEWKERRVVPEALDIIRTSYFYTADTCKGSSGAPLWLLGNKGDNKFVMFGYLHVHSEGLLDGLNKSGAAFELTSHIPEGVVYN